VARVDGSLTWLPLARWAEWFGINPLHFNQLTSADYPGDSCGDVWYQYAWMHSDQVSREDVARAIRSAELAIADQLRYHLIPDWIGAEKVPVPRPVRRDVYGLGMLNIRAQQKSFELRRGHIIAGGYRVKQELSSGLPIVRSDEDGDGYDETCSVVFATSVTDPQQIHLYFPGKQADDHWEIRPLDSVSISGGVATILFKSWLIPDPDLIMQGEAIDGDDATNYIATVDAYRLYNDPGTQATLIWEPVGGSLCGCGQASCTICTVASQAACMGMRDQETGFVTAFPASYSDGEWTAQALAFERDADRLLAYYYSGWQDPHSDRPNVDMDPFWVEAVAKYSAGLLDRKVCSCNNAETHIDELRRDIAAVRQGIVFQSSTESQIGNPFGTTVGAIFAWNRVNVPGRALPK
jgi:hypothetical protein